MTNKNEKNEIEIIGYRPARYQGEPKEHRAIKRLKRPFTWEKPK